MSRLGPAIGVASRTRSSALASAVIGALIGALVVAPQQARGGVQGSAPSLIASPTIGPPTSPVIVSGLGFEGSEYVDVFFDNTSLRSAGSFLASPTGAGSAHVTVPPSASPKPHEWIALGRSSRRQVQTSFLVRTDWTQLGFDAARRGYNPYENVLNAHTLATLHKVWTIPGEINCCGGPTNPVIANGTVYVGETASNGTNDDHAPALGAYNAATGKLRWRSRLGPLVRGGGVSPARMPAEANGTVYVLTLDYAGIAGRKLWALNAISGAVRWSTALAASNYSQYDEPPVVAGGLVFVYREVFDAVTGVRRWSVPSPPDRPGKGCEVIFPGIQTVTVSDGVAYFRCFGNSDYFEARNAATGQLRWRRPTSSSATVPIVVGGIMYYGSADRLVARDAATGTLRWATPTTAPVGQPSVGRGVVYASVGYHDIEAFDATTGIALWRTTVGSTTAPLLTVANGVVYLRTLNYLQALDASNGRLIRKVASKFFGRSPIAVVNGVVFTYSTFGLDAFATNLELPPIAT